MTNESSPSPRIPAPVPPCPHTDLYATRQSDPRLIQSDQSPSVTSPDALATLPIAACKPIDYPAFEPPLSADI
ncbi:hypothetical protein MSAN_02352000 [Mycena sanguinolenta]|uniref:Uncharacterized protein n=1 Tax=Mycena sanguinolenta TaxID=230812 RepID=A0A8H7CGK9_9AGAR|nr:hypothetical protein MSAN_02352000 [Mycena sanguinolenta]